MEIIPLVPLIGLLHIAIHRESVDGVFGMELPSQIYGMITRLIDSPSAVSKNSHYKQ